MKENPPKELKILQLPSWYLPEGGDFCRNQSSLLQKSGAKLAILANVELPWRKYKLKTLIYPYKPSFNQEGGLTVYRNYMRRIPGLEKQNVHRWIKRTYRLFEEYIRKEGLPDIIHVHSAMWAGYVAYMIKEKYRIPYVITEHRGRFGRNVQPLKQHFKDWYTPMLRKAFSNAAHIIPVSEQLIDKINTFSSGKVPWTVISNVVDPVFEYRVHQKQSRFVFFTANSFHQVKAYDILLAAFESVCQRQDEVELRIAGNGFDCREFQAFLAGNRYADRIHLCGLLSPVQVMEELCKADAFVLASRVEAQPVAVLEALNVGVPVVSTEVVPEEILSDRQGYRVPINDPDRLAEAMLRMIANVNVFDRRAISEEAGWQSGADSFLTKTMAIYDKVLGFV